MAFPISLLKAIKGYFTLKKALKNTTQPPKLVVGASGVFEAGWIPTDVHTVNLLKPERWKIFFPENSISVILAEHVWEHLSLADGKTAAKTCYRFLKPGGYARIAVPDGFFYKQEYIDYVKPGGSGAGADDHKVLYNYKLMSEVFEEAGFKVHLLEYFDEDRKFHYNEWDPAKGMVHRSKRFDDRNHGDDLNYTSLIIDAIKT